MFGGGDAPAPLIVLGTFPYTHSIRNCDQNVMYGVKLASIFDDGVINLLLLLRDLQNDGNTHHQEFQRRNYEVTDNLALYSKIDFSRVLAAVNYLSDLRLLSQKINSIERGQGSVSINSINSNPKRDGRTINDEFGVKVPIKRHVCQFCGRSFTKLSKLSRHEITHTGNRPYKCLFPGCCKTYTRNDHLARHVQVHVPNRK